eukprot:g3677.t1
MEKKKNEDDLKTNEDVGLAEIQLTESNEVLKEKEKNLALDGGDRFSTSAKKLIGEERCLYCKLLGFRGLLGFVLILIIGGLLLFAYTQFSSKPFYLLLLVIGTLMHPIAFIYLLYKAVKDLSKNETLKNDKGREEEAETLSCIQLQWRCLKQSYCEVFDPDGKRYLSKTYTSEIMEYMNQIFAISYSYNCNFPTPILVAVLSLFTIEAMVVTCDTIWTVRNGLSVARRNNKIMLDIFLDIFCATVPVLIMYLGYGLIFTTTEFAFMAIIPAISANGKLYEIVDATIRERAAIYKNKLRTKSMKRFSFFKFYRDVKLDDENSRIPKEQMEATPWWVHWVFALLTSFYVLFLLSAIVSNIIVSSSFNCDHTFNKDNKIWESCQVKVPLCNNLFTPSCNCALLDLKVHNMTALPGNFVKMTALKKAFINHGPLKTLPSDIEQLISLRHFDLWDNQLTTLTENLGKMEIIKLNVAFNSLNEIPISIWGSKNLQYFDLSNNNISSVDDAIHNAIELRTLFLSNNSITESSLSSLPINLIVLNIEGNNLKAIPERINILTELRDLLMQNNIDIHSVPSGLLPRLKKLVKIDLRNNSISQLPDDFGDARNLKIAYFHGNEICSNLETVSRKIKKLFDNQIATCQKQCSPYCRDEWLERKSCLRECNSKECSFQNGVCL